MSARTIPKQSRLTRRLLSTLTIFCFGVLGFACGTGGDDAEGTSTGTRAPFIAFAADFKDYRKWDSTPGTSPNPPASIHTMGTRTVYINKKPSPGSKTFPVGTIIVKELSDPALVDRQVFAMVKRGENYNVEGARDWEWFELSNIDASSVNIIWHGVGPPAGEKYGGDPNGGCNGCHSAASANDYVQTTGLSLASF